MAMTHSAFIVLCHSVLRAACTVALNRTSILDGACPARISSWVGRVIVGSERSQPIKASSRLPDQGYTGSASAPVELVPMRAPSGPGANFAKTT